MPYLTTLAELRPLVRSLAAVQRLKFFTDDDLNPWLVSGWGRLYDIFVESGNPYFEREKDVTLRSGEAIAIPADLQVLRRVDALDGQGVGELPDLDVHDLAPTPESSPAGGACGYRFRAQELQLPGASLGQAFRVTYVPRLVEPRDATGAYLDTSPMDCVTIKGRDYVVLLAGVRCLQKQREDSAGLAAEGLALRREIEVSSMRRTVGRLRRVAEIVSFDDPFTRRGR